MSIARAACRATTRSLGSLLFPALSRSVKTLPMGGPGKLVDLGNVTELSPRVTRVLGQNPGLMTLQGTNSYLLGAGADSPLILVDTTQPNTADAYAQVLLSHLEAKGKPAIEHIVMTHRHIDHIGGIAPVLKGLKAQGYPAPKIWKAVSPDEAALQANGRDSIHSDKTLIDAVKACDGAYVPTPEGAQVWDLNPGDRVSVSAGGKKLDAVVLPTPGHTADSISIILEPSDGEDGPTVLTGDTVLGQGTTIFTDFAAYMKSLRTLYDLKPSVLYPAHGPSIVGRQECDDHLAAYIKHRQDREDTIVEEFQKIAANPGIIGRQLDEIRHAEAEKHKAEGDPTAPAAPLAKESLQHVPDFAALFPGPQDPGASAVTLPLLCRLIYKSGHQPLIMAAMRTITAHIEKLEAEGRVRKVTASLPRIVGWTVEGTEPTEAYEWVG